jgi:hypothetical protein
MAVSVQVDGPFHCVLDRFFDFVSIQADVRAIPDHFMDSAKIEHQDQ